MQKREYKNIDEIVYEDRLSNGTRFVFIPKKTNKKYIIWGFKYGSIDTEFISNGKRIKVPDGSAHYLEHKLFEQRTGINSLDTLTNLGVDANAFTTNDHTAYLYECTDNFYKALDEFMDYVQNPYFTDENVEKERGIIGQEIMMYKDDVSSEVYVKALEAMYKNNKIRIDIAGSIESIAEISKETLYDIYNNFYTPQNGIITVVGDFEFDSIKAEIEKRLIMHDENKEIIRVYEEEPKEINRKESIKKMDISIPSFIIGFKDNDLKDFSKKTIGIEVFLNYLLSKSSKLYNKLYEEGMIISDFSLIYEFSECFAHVLIMGQSLNPKYVQEMIEKEIENVKQKGINKERFESIKKLVYGEMITVNLATPQTIGTEVMVQKLKGLDFFDYFDIFKNIDENYVLELINNMFSKDREVISIINPKDIKKE